MNFAWSQKLGNEIINKKGIFYTNQLDSSFLYSVCKSICDFDYVFLGEADHGDGSNHLIKSEIVKVLHKDFGYNVLVIEDDFFHLEEMHSVMGYSKFSDSSNIFNNIWAIWSETKDCQELFYKIIPFDTASPFYLSGFDIQLQGAYAKGFLAIKTDSFLQASKIEFTKSKEYKEFFLNYLRYSVFYRVQDSANLIRFQKDCINIKNELLEIGINNQFWFLVFDNFVAYTNILLQPNVGTTCKRDIQMANVAKYLIDGPYKNMKIIFWGQSGHFFKNHSKLYEGYYSMGEVLFQDSIIRRKSIVLACTSYKGFYLDYRTDKIEKIPKSANSIESKINKYGKYAFINSKELEPNDKRYFFNGKAHFAAHSFYKNNWSNSIDGIIFIRTSHPVKYIKF